MKPEHLSARGIQTAWLCFLLCPFHRRGGPGGLLHHVMGSGSRKPSSLWLLHFLSVIEAKPFDSSSKLFNILVKLSGKIWVLLLLPGRLGLSLTLLWEHYQWKMTPNMQLVCSSHYCNTSEKTYNLIFFLSLFSRKFILGFKEKKDSWLWLYRIIMPLEIYLVICAVEHCFLPLFSLFLYTYLNTDCFPCTLQNWGPDTGPDLL